MPRIAEKIFLSYHTVRDHVKKIHQKLHVASATEAVAKALKEKLVQYFTSTISITFSLLH